jgi:hypothetical protein
MGAIAVLAADTVHSKRNLADYSIRVGRPDGAKVRKTDVVVYGSSTVYRALSSKQDFEMFVSSMKAGQRLKWEIGCDYADLVERDANGKERKRDDGRPAFVLPLGSERVPLTEIEEICGSRGVEFKFGFGY